MRLLIYINDQLIKIDPKTIVAYTYQNTFMMDLTTRRVSHTNELDFPATPENDIIFGFARLEKSDAAPTKRQLSAKIIRNGHTILKGVASIKLAGERYRVRFFDGFKQFADILSDKTIDDLVGIDPNLTVWDASEITSLRASSSGLVAPVINYGQISRQFLINTDWTVAATTAYWEQYKLIPEGGSGQYQDKEFSAASGTYLTAELDSYAIGTGVNEFEQPGGTVMFRQKYKFYPGQTYQIQLRHNYVGTGQVRGQVHLMEEGSTRTSKVLDAVHISATTDTVTFTPDREYQYIAIFGFLAPPSPTIGGASLSGDLRIYFITVTLKLEMTAAAYFPAVYYKSIFQAIYEAAGYAVEQTSVFSDDIYTNLIVPFSKERFEYSGFFNTCREFKASVITQQTIIADGQVIFGGIDTKDLFGFYNPTTGIYDCDSSYQPSYPYDTRSFYSKFYATFEVILISGTINFQLQSQGYGVMDLQGISTPGRYIITLVANKFGTDSDGFNMVGGDNVSVFADVIGAANCIVLNGTFYNTVNGINQRATDPGFYACEILPPIKQKDFIKDMFVRFGIIPYEKDQYLVLKTLEEVINDRAGALDWTLKRDKSRPDEMDFKTTYAQNNYLRYPSDDTSFDPYYTNGNIQVDNDNLEPELTLYDSLFSGSVDISVNVESSSLYMGLVKLNEKAKTAYPTPNGEEMDLSVNPRLMIVRPKSSAEPQVFYSSVAYTNYLIANFTLPDGKPLGWEAFIDRFYNSAKRAIGRNRPLVRYYNLTDADISQVHPHRLIYDDGGYFIIETIPNYTGDQVTEVVLFKVS